MAESLNKKDTAPMIHDDMIKEALKTGLASIEASDELIGKTLAKCREEISHLSSCSAPKPAFYRQFLKFSAPLAAGALVLVLIFNYGGLFARQKNATFAAPAPQASAEAAKTTEDGAAGEPDYGTGNSRAAAPRLGIDFSEPSANDATAASPEPVQEDSVQKGFAAESDMMVAFNSALMNSSVQYIRFDMARAGEDESIQAFRAIVAQYNTSNGTQLTLDESRIACVNTLIETGVTGDMLLNAKSLREFLSGKVYWVLPLKNSNGLTETVLAVNRVGRSQDIPVSGADIVYEQDEQIYIGSPNPAGTAIAKNLDILFDTKAIEKVLQDAGYGSAAEIRLIDINYGMDFIAFAVLDGKELALPLLTNDNLYGLSNGRVYTMEELVKAIVESVK